MKKVIGAVALACVLVAIGAFLGWRGTQNSLMSAKLTIYEYHKVDRGFYETAYAIWRRQGGRFFDHLVRSQPSIDTWSRELERQGCRVVLDLRSSFLLPQTLRCYLPLAAAAPSSRSRHSSTSSQVR